jgi:protein SCO1
MPLLINRAHPTPAVANPPIFSYRPGEPLRPPRVDWLPIPMLKSRTPFAVLSSARVTFALLAIAAVVAGGAALLLTTSDPARVFTVRGVVRAPYHDGTLLVQHEEIPDFMPAMTMPFHVDAADVKDLAAGDRVEFEFRVGERSRATRFRRLPAGTEPRVAIAPVSPAPPAQQRLRAGDPLPAFSLTDQDNQPLGPEDLRGRQTVVTFIFTRCPVPEFCPLIARKFQSLQNAIARRPAGAKRVQLLSISIDPEHDRPPVLRAYGESLGAEFARWRFATGTSPEIERLTRLFAVRTERNGGSLDHTLATALIGPDGTVTEIWRGNGWKPEEVLAKLD